MASSKKEGGSYDRTASYRGNKLLVWIASVPWLLVQLLWNASRLYIPRDQPRKPYKTLIFWLQRLQFLRGERRDKISIRDNYKTTRSLYRRVLAISRSIRADVSSRHCSLRLLRPSYGPYWCISVVTANFTSHFTLCRVGSGFCDYPEIVVSL